MRECWLEGMLSSSGAYRMQQGVLQEGEEGAEGGIWYSMDGRDRESECRDGKQVVQRDVERDLQGRNWMMLDRR
jgi:hypothetical protein